MGPLATLAVGIVLGVLVERVVFPVILSLTRKTQWAGDDVIVHSFRGVTTVIFAAVALYIGSLTVDLTDSAAFWVARGVIAVVILMLTIASSRIAAGFVGLYSGRIKGELPQSSIFTHLTQAFVFIIGVLMILQSLGISITPLLTALGVGGLAVALALQDTLSNLFAGLQIILGKQLRIGDYVLLETGQEGYVEDIHWRNTTIRQWSNNMIIVPNATLANSITTNFNQPAHEMSLLIHCGVSYDTDLEVAERIAKEVAREAMDVLPQGVSDYEPAVRFHEFGDSSINFKVVLRTKNRDDQFLLKHEYIKRLHRAFDKEGIEIPFPIRTVYMADNEDPEAVYEEGSRSEKSTAPSGKRAVGAGPEGGDGE